MTMHIFNNVDESTHKVTTGTTTTVETIATNGKIAVVLLWDLPKREYGIRIDQ